jgi:hypothetical protein
MTDLDRETRRWRIAGIVAVHVVGGLVTIASWCGIFVAVVLVRWDNSVCGTATAQEVHDSRIASLGFGLLVASAPLVVGVVIRLLKMRAWPWFAIAAFLAVVALVASVRTQPEQWCF